MYVALPTYSSDTRRKLSSWNIPTPAMSATGCRNACFCERLSLSNKDKKWVNWQDNLFTFWHILPPSQRLTREKAASDCSSKEIRMSLAVPKLFQTSKERWHEILNTMQVCTRPSVVRAQVCKAFASPQRLFIHKPMKINGPRHVEAPNKAWVGSQGIKLLFFTEVSNENFSNTNSMARKLNLCILYLAVEE